MSMLKPTFNIPISSIKKKVDNSSTFIRIIQIEKSKRVCLIDKDLNTERKKQS